LRYLNQTDRICINVSFVHSD